MAEPRNLPDPRNNTHRKTMRKEGPLVVTTNTHKVTMATTMGMATRKATIKDSDNLPRMPEVEEDRARHQEDIRHRTRIRITHPKEHRDM